MPLLAAVFVLALVALYGMGMMFASMFLMLGREGWHLVNLAQEPVFLLSGTFFPIAASTSGWQRAPRSFRLTLALDAIRQLSFASGAERGDFSTYQRGGGLAGLCVLFLIASRMLLQRLERMAIGGRTLHRARA